jgi:hypothetical protein
MELERLAAGEFLSHITGTMTTPDILIAAEAEYVKLK